MIYLVSNTIDCSSMEGIEPLSVDDAILRIRSWPVVQYDSETTGLDAHVNELISMQFGYKDYKKGEETRIVVDCRSVSPLLFKDVMESSTLIGHNIKFDLEFLYNYGIVPLNVYDTMICEQVLYLGYSRKKIAFKLSAVLARYTGITLDKTMQTLIAHEGLTERGIRYAADDVVYLQDIRKGQILVAKSRNCTKAFTVENWFVPAIAYLEWCGVHLDEQKWREWMDINYTTMTEYRDKLNEYVTSHTELNDMFTSSMTQMSLFEETPHVNWNSPEQTLPIFQTLGFDTLTRDKKTKQMRHSVEEKVVSVQRGIADDFLDIYLGYKKANKNVSTYGDSFIYQINPDTDRIHTAFHQIGTVTGRMSSGSRTPNRDLAKRKGLRADLVQYCNMQNLPARGKLGKIARACFTSTGDNVFVSCDYSAQESRVQADVWNEPKLLNAFREGIDTHNLYAKMCYPDELKDVDVKDVKDVRPDLRQNAKFFEFELSYGGNGSETAKKLGIDPQIAMNNVANVLKEMPGMMASKKKTIRFLKKNGYIVINEITGHRIYWPEWSQWKAEEDRMDRAFWNDYMAYHKGTDDEICHMVRRHNERSKDWFAKNVLNYPIQGGSAIMTKQAAGDLFRWIVRNGYFGKILFCVIVHDEIDCECPKELADMFSKKIEQIMEKAAARYYHKINIPASCECGKFWIH